MFEETEGKIRSNAEEYAIYIASYKGVVNYLVGKNAQGNFDIIDMAKECDVWFHVEGSPSCHVIARMPEGGINKKQRHSILVQGAVLCKRYSKQKSVKDLKIVYTEISNVEKTDVLGSVHITGGRSIVI